MKKFNWKIAKQRHNEKAFEFLKEIHDIAISEDKFIEEWGKLRKFSQSKHPKEIYAPNRARKMYRYLKTKFSFF